MRGKSGVGVVVGLFFAAMAAAGAASDWPTYMHDRSRAGVSPDSLSTPMARAWSFDSPVPPERAFSGPENRAYEGSRVLRSRIRFDDAFQVAMAGGGVFFGSSVDGRIHCIDAATGAGRWTFFTGGPVRLAPTVSGGRVYAGSDDGCVYCLDAGSGELVWKLRAGPRDDRLLARGRMTSRWPVRTGILVDGGIAYFGAGVFPADTVYLYAVDAATGKVVWKNDWLSERDANRSDFSPQGYMLATDKTLFVPSGRSLPAAIDRAGGDMLFQSRPQWRDAAGGAVGGTDALLAAGQIYSVGEHHILAMDQKRGKTGFGWFLATRMTMDAKTAYMANGKEIIAVDHAKRAEASRKRHALELKRMVVVRQIAAHPAPKLLKDATRLEAKLKAARTRLEKLSSAGARTSPEHAAAKKAAAKAEAAYRAAAAKYEPARKAFNKLRETRKSMEAQIAKLKTVAIKWRFATPYESSLILAGKTLVAGGKGGVLVLDAGSGKLLWKHVVAGEARGLAVAGGRLVVSTAKGHVVCFAPGGKTAGAGRKPRLRMVPPAPVPYPPDGLSALYADAAESILAATGVRRGYCLVLGAGEGRLAYEIARRSDLTVFGVSPDRKAVDAGREKLAATGLYGTRITLDALEPGAPIPYPDYFANLIVSDSLVKTGKIPGNAVAVARFLKPVGGMICLGVPGGADAAGPGAAARWLDATGLPANGEASVATHGGWTVLTRGKLPGAGDWTQEYGNAGNTSSNEGERTRGGLQVLWYGDPGPGEMVNRHYAAVAPVSANGRFFIENIHSVQAYDAYNGLLLWEFGNRGADIRKANRNANPGNMVATDDFLFMVNGAECHQLDAATGKTVRKYRIPDAGEPDAGGARQWTYVSHSDGILFGTSTGKARLGAVRAKGGWLAADATDRLFAYDTRTGKLLWDYRGKSISHVAIAVGNGRIYFVDSSMTPEQRAEFIRQDKAAFEKLSGEARKRAEGRLKSLDLRMAVALDAKTGGKIWNKPVDVTDCSKIGEGGGALTMMYAKERLVLCGANANGHYWKQFLAGEFKRRRLVVLSAATGEREWARDANYRIRPLIVGHEIIAEPWAYDLYTGEQKMRPHPLTGEPTPWKFIRPGHHCGATTATKHMMFYRSWFTAYYDLDRDDGTRHFGGHRSGCWINSVPANGLVIVPEASAGCVCLFSIAATVVFEPREKTNSWGVFAAEGPATPVRRMSLNLGAPGDRRDASGRLWLAYPRPNSRRGLEFSIGVKADFRKGGHWFSRNSRGLGDAPGDGAPPSWIFASGGRGISRCGLTLRRKTDGPASYTVRLVLSADGAPPSPAAPEVKLQGKPVHPSSVRNLAGGGISMEFRDVPVGGSLAIELAQPSSSSPVTLCGVEVEETEK